MPGGRPRKLKSITVVAVDRERYPRFLKDRDHPFIELGEEQRLAEAIEACAQVLARYSLDLARSSKEEDRKAA